MPKKETDVEELLKIVNSEEKAPKKTDPKPVNEIERFIASVGIRAGETRVPNLTVYDLYRHWARKPMSQKKFGSIFTKLFKQRRWCKLRFYMLDPAPFDLSAEKYLEVRDEFRRKYKKRYKKTAQTLKKESGGIRPENESQQSQISGPDSASKSEK